MLPIDVALGNNPGKDLGDDDSTNRVSTLTSKLSTIRDKVKKRMAVVQSKQKKRYDRRRRQAEFAVGDPVLVFRPIRKKGRTTKFLHRYFGPYRIVRRVSDLNYIVEPFHGRKKSRDCVHVSHLKPFRLRAPSGKMSVQPPVIKIPLPVSIIKKKASGSSVKEKTPKVVRWCDQPCRDVVRKNKQLGEKDAPTLSEFSDQRVGGHILRSRRRLRSPTRLDL